jgi:heme-degrading monooxygenase HmoA
MVWKPTHHGEIAMHARIVTVQGSPEKMQDPGSTFRERVLPALQEQAGFNGVYVLLDRARGRLLGISLWESDEAAGAGMAALEPIRNQAAAAMGAPAPSVEGYEVVYSSG